MLIGRQKQSDNNEKCWVETFTGGRAGVGAQLILGSWGSAVQDGYLGASGVLLEEMCSRQRGLQVEEMETGTPSGMYVAQQGRKNRDVGWGRG